MYRQRLKGFSVLVLGKRKPPGSATAYRADPQEAGFADGTGTFPSLVRLSRPHRETTAVPAAGPTPLGLAAAAQINENNENLGSYMLSATESGDRITVKCSCGCYSLTAHKPAEAHDGLVRCLMCGARARLADLMKDCRARGNLNIDTQKS